MQTEAPISLPMAQSSTEQAWEQVNNLFRHHGLAEPPTRLRDEIVVALLWAWYGVKLNSGLASIRDLTDEEISTELFQLGQQASEGEHSGSAGEWIFERRDQLIAEQDRRSGLSEPEELTPYQRGFLDGEQHATECDLFATDRTHADAAALTRPQPASTALVERLTKALEPFCKHYEPWMERWDDQEASSTFSRHTFGDLREALAALNEARAALSASQSTSSEGER